MGLNILFLDFYILNQKLKKALQSRAKYIVLAAETANLAENLPDGVTTGVAICVAREEGHLADLLFRICLAKTTEL